MPSNPNSYASTSLTCRKTMSTKIRIANLRICYQLSQLLRTATKIRILPLEGENSRGILSLLPLLLGNSRNTGDLLLGNSLDKRRYFISSSWEIKYEVEVL